MLNSVTFGDSSRILFGNTGIASVRSKRRLSAIMIRCISRVASALSDALPMK